MDTMQRQHHIILNTLLRALQYGILQPNDIVRQACTAIIKLNEPPMWLIELASSPDGNLNTFYHRLQNMAAYALDVFSSPALLGLLHEQIQWHVLTIDDALAILSALAYQDIPSFSTIPLKKNALFNVITTLKN